LGGAGRKGPWAETSTWEGRVRGKVIIELAYSKQADAQRAKDTRDARR
jgi:hypothetical protein